MIRDITLGQYYQAESWIHRLDPRLKIIATLVYIAALFVVDDFLGFIIAAVVLGVVIAVSKVPLKFILRGLKPDFSHHSFYLCSEFCLWCREKYSYMSGFSALQKKAMRMAVFMAARLILLIIGSSLLTLTTKPISSDRWN